MDFEKEEVQVNISLHRLVLKNRWKERKRYILLLYRFLKSLRQSK